MIQGNLTVTVATTMTTLLHANIHWHLFIITTIIMSLIPGIAMLFTISQSAQNGFKTGVIACLGVELGTFIYLLISLVLLLTLFHTAHWVFETIQIGGALYLLYLGIMAFAHIKQSQITLNKPKTHLYKKVFLKGCLINLLNPKIGLFFLAFLPQFVDPHAPKLWLQLFVLGVIFNLAGVVVNLLAALIVNPATLSMHSKQNHALAKYTWLTSAIPGVLFIFLALYTLMQVFR